MKLRTEKGKWIVTDGKWELVDGKWVWLSLGKEIDFGENQMVAWEYVLVMMLLRKNPHISRKGECIVKSLTPNPKKRRMTKKWKEKIKRYKQIFEAGVHEV